MKALSCNDANDARDSMMKGLYGRLFDWIVRKVNVCMAGDINTEGNSSSGSGSKGDACVVGILDIFGFEIFEHNSFEQL